MLVSIVASKSVVSKFRMQEVLKMATDRHLCVNCAVVSKPIMSRPKEVSHLVDEGLQWHSTYDIPRWIVREAMLQHYKVGRSKKVVDVICTLSLLVILGHPGRGKFSRVSRGFDSVNFTTYTATSICAGQKYCYVC